jgi:hypothetical protein
MKRALAVAICGLAIPASRAEAWNPLKAAEARFEAAGGAVGGALGAPAGGFIESATTPVIHSAEDSGHRLIADLDRTIASNLDRTGGLINQASAAAKDTVAQVDHSLAARILQIQTGVDHTIDHAFDRVDLVVGRLESDAQQLLERAERAGRDLIKQLDDTAAANLARIDKLLAARINDLRLVVSSSIQQADDAARQRLEQVDAIAGRRIGNLDVIATKQSLSLEGMLVRIAALVGLVGLIAFAAWRLFRELADALAIASQRGTPRLRAIGWQSITRLVPQLALAAAGALLLNFLADYLPRDSERRARAQVASQIAAFDAAARALDVTEARYRESQLEVLAPADLAQYRGRLQKVALLHSLFTRPGQLHTQQGLADLVAQVADVEAALGVTDPDVMIAKAYVLWQVGGTRDDEYEAAGLCAEALRGGGRPLLAPLARNYILAFLDDPYPPHDPAGPSVDEIARAGALAPRAGETPQFDRVIELDRMIRELDRASTAAYLDMLAAHADLRIALRRSSPGPEPAAARAARAARTAAANRLIDAWAAFDRGLEASPALASDAIVLSVFTLDDAVLTHARYWAAVPSANGLAPSLTDPSSAKTLAPVLRARIAPLRVAWDKRYAPMLGPSEREIVAYQETARFAAFEQRAAAFETSYVDFLVAAHGDEAPGRLLEVATAAATRASGMGLYHDTPGGRLSEASRILAVLEAHGQQAPSDALATIAHNYQVRRLRLL